MLGSEQGQSLTFFVRHVFLRRSLQSCELHSSRRTLHRVGPGPAEVRALVPLSRRWTRATQSTPWLQSLLQSCGSGWPSRPRSVRETGQEGPGGERIARAPRATGWRCGWTSCTLTSWRSRSDDRSPGTATATIKCETRRTATTRRRSGRAAWWRGQEDGLHLHGLPCFDGVHCLVPPSRASGRSASL